jgi:cytochrome c553
MGLITGVWMRPLILGLAAAVVCISPAFAQGASLAERIGQCNACHGEDGNSLTPNIPSIAGQPAFFLLNQLFLMREGVRKVESMVPFVKDLKDSDIEALAKHFADLPAKPSNEPIDQELVRRGAALAEARRCGSCHLPDLTGQIQMPRLAKQRIDYLLQSLREYRNGRRPGADTAMSAIIAGLSDDDLAALAHYSASR